MAIASDKQSEDRRTPLTRARVLDAAVALADRDGIDGVSMRNLGQELGIEAMSLYTHIRGKEDLLDGMVDVVVGEIPVDPLGPDWRTTLRRTIIGARTVMLSHRWAARVIETRNAPGPATLAYMEAVTGIVREGGFSVDLTHHAMHVLGSRVLGFNQDSVRRFGRPRPRGGGDLRGPAGRGLPERRRHRDGGQPRGRTRWLRRRLRVRVRARPHP